MFQCSGWRHENYCGVKSSGHQLGSSMKQQRAPRTPKRRPQTAKTERKEEYDAVINTDALLKEVGEANEQIADPSERERVIPSRPCEPK
jgi:hypothetical protein